MMNRIEKRYYWKTSILAWCHGTYTEEQLDRMTMPELCELFNQFYSQRIVEMETIEK